MFSPAHLAGLNCFQCWTGGASVAACGKDEDGDPACEKHMADQPVAEPISSSENQQESEKTMYPRKNLDPQQIQQMREQGKGTVEIARTLGVAVSTVYKYEGKTSAPRKKYTRKPKPRDVEVHGVQMPMPEPPNEPIVMLNLPLNTRQIERLLSLLL